MQRVAVIGCGGSGKTTLARALAGKLALPLYHFDTLYYPNATPPPLSDAEWEEVHSRLIAAESWILDGMKLATLPARLDRADTVIFLDLPARSCLWGIIARRLRYRGHHQPELGVYDVLNLSFLAWTFRFRHLHRPRILALLAAAKSRGVTVVILSSRREVRRYLAGLPARPT
jgi:adenylate kinase family enzyme